MSSINTNAGAMTALQTLKATNKNLDVTQGRISTGFRVSEASHNAAYWSIATTMRSDNNAMSTVKDALGLGAAQVDIAYTAMDAVKDTLDTMKKKLVAASQPDIDKVAIQKEIEQLKNDLQTFAESATFSGGNWLKVDTAETQKVVASFVRSDSGVSLATIDVDTSKTALFTTAGTDGLLEGGIEVTPEGAAIEGLGSLTGSATLDGDGDGTIAITGSDSVTWADGDSLSFTVNIGGTASPVTAEYDGSAWTLTGAPTGVTLTVNGDGELEFAFADAGDDAAVTISGFSGTHAAGDAEEMGVTNLDITQLSAADLEKMIGHVDEVFGKVTTAASELGAIKTRIGSQQDFVGKIMDAVARGVGQLVDADMEEESTRLQALQVQQQLGIQALSIANGNTQNILSLFR